MKNIYIWLVIFFFGLGMYSIIEPTLTKQAIEESKEIHKKIMQYERDSWNNTFLGGGSLCKPVAYDGSNPICKLEVFDACGIPTGHCLRYKSLFIIDVAPIYIGILGFGGGIICLCLYFIRRKKYHGIENSSL